MTPPRLLYLASHWPPISGVPAYRAVKFAKALRAAGVELIVLTAGNAPEAHVADNSWADDVKEIETLRVPVPSLRTWLGNRRLSRMVELPDSYVGWIRPLLRAGRELIRRRPITGVFTTVPPYSLLRVGALLAHEARAEWLCDIRDLGADNPFYSGKHWVRRRIEAWWEERYLRLADQITTATEGIGDYHAARGASREKLRFVATGYDEDDFTGLTVTPSPAPGKILAHVGALHGYRDVGAILEGLRLGPEQLHLRQVGFASQAAREALRAAAAGRLAGRVTLLPHQSHREALREMLAADLLLLVETRAEPPGGIIQQKLYQYLRAPAPILAVSPENEMTRMLAATGRGKAVWPPAPERIASAMRELLDSASPCRMAGEVRAEVARYEVRRTSRELVEMISRQG